MNIDFAIGLHIVGFLASRDGEPLTSVIMAKSFGTNPVVLRRVLARLKNAGLVTTKRGAQGGSVLAKDATQISLKDVYESVCETTEVFGRHPKGDGVVADVLGSYINDFYIDAETSMLNHLDSINIADMDAVVRPKIMAAFKCK